MIIEKGERRSMPFSHIFNRVSFISCEQYDRNMKNRQLDGPRGIRKSIFERLHVIFEYCSEFPK